MLNADAKEDKNLMYAFGYGTINNPKSIDAGKLFERCRYVLPKFTEDDVKSCKCLIEFRNEQLHSGGDGFESLPRAWLAEYFRICKRLLSFQRRSLTDFLGQREARAARKMMRAAGRQAIAIAAKAIATAKKTFESLPLDEKTIRTNRAVGLAALSQVLGRVVGKHIPCPACGAAALLRGEPIRTAGPRVEGGKIVLDTSYLATRFYCLVCELELRGLELLHAARLAQQYTVRKSFDPSEYDEYAVEFERSVDWNDGLSRIE